MASKVCNRCHVEKELGEFGSTVGKYGRWYRNTCKKCLRAKTNEYSRRRNVKDREKVNARNAKWEAEHREYVLARMRIYNQQHKMEIIEKAKECRRKKPEQYRAAARRRAANRRATDMNFRLKDVLRKRMRNALLGLSKADRTMNLLGCSMDELKRHLEFQFRDGMIWDNYGKHGWHIDHVIPCCAFDLAKEDEQRKCFHYTNLRPLWAEENWAKTAQDKQCKAA